MCRWIGIDLFEERPNDLVLAHRGDFFRVKGLRIEAGARHDRHAGLHRGLAHEAEIAPHVRMAGVHDAGDAFPFGGAEFIGHQTHVPHGIRTWRRRGRSTRASREGRKTIRGPGGTRRCAEPRVEVRRQRHVLVEKRRAASQLLGLVVFERVLMIAPFGNVGV
jgi:hypothetical protein